MEADTARVTLFDGGDIMYGNNVKSIAESLDSICGVACGGGECMGEGERDGGWRREMVDGW